MGRIVVSRNITLDGVWQNPTGEDGGWFGRTTDRDREAWAEVETEEAAQAAALLLGRRSYEYFAGRWATREGVWADRLRALPKYVVSSSPVEGWPNATVVDLDAAAKLKHEIDGDIVVYASGPLVRALLAQDLVDEIRMMVFPVTADGGVRPVRLTGKRPVGDGLTLLTYAV